jgi:hypothetical protein
MLSLWCIWFVVLEQINFQKWKKELLIYFRFGDVCERSRTTYQVASEGFSVGNEMQETNEKSN